jgi:hypothetical protein
VGTDVSEERYKTEPDNGTDIKLKRVESDFVKYWIKLFTIIRHLYLLLSMSKVIFLLMKDKHEIAWIWNMNMNMDMNLNLNIF